MNTQGRMIRIDSRPPGPDGHPPTPTPAPLARRRPASLAARKRWLQVVDDWRAAERVIANQQVRLAEQAKRISQLEGELQQATANARRWSKDNHALVLQLAAVSGRARE